MESRIFQCIATELNNKCSRRNNYSLGDIGSDWKSSDFEIQDCVFTHNSAGCYDCWGFQCDKCSELLEMWQNEFKELFCKHNAKTLGNMIKELEDLKEKMKVLEEEINHLKNN